MANNQEQKLLADFPAIPTQKWEEVITADLKGADYQKKLVWRTAEGFNVRPYYRAEDLKEIAHMGVGIAEFPYVRSVCKSNKWKVHQTIEVIDLKGANEKALKAIEGGADSIGFLISTESCNEETLNMLLEGIDLNKTELVFSGTGAKQVPAKIMVKIHQMGLEPKNVKISFDIDPIINCLTLKGKCNCSGDGAKCFQRIKTLISDCAMYPKLRFISVNGRHFSGCGSTIVQELAFSLAVGHEYLVKLLDAGLTTDQIARSMRFNLSVSSNYFMEIAKFRAARMLWANIVKSYSPERTCSAKMRIHAETAKWNTTAYDPYVNMLRGTTEAMSAAIAGVHSLEVTPFNFPYEKATDFSSRIARNVQLLLKYESHFDNVVDPAGGSYYIENLTASIAEQAWNLFKQVEEMGGYIAAFNAGFIQDQIEASAAKKDINIATRREILLGTNQYPNFNEKANPGVTKEDVTRATKTDCGCSCDSKGDDTADSPRPLKLYRGAMAFEEMRWSVDRSGRELKAFMLTSGALSMARARAQFSCNFFACAGIRVIDNTYFADVEEGVKQAIAAKADIVVVCASDDDYAELAPKVKELLADNKAILVVAGAPACQPELEAKGITHFISVKNNVLETLKSYLQELGC